MPQEVDVTTRSVVLAISFSVLGLLVIGFPADLFNRTLRTNYARIARVFPWMGRDRLPSSSGRRQIVAFLASCAIAGLIGSLQKVQEWSPRGVLTIAASVAFGYLVTAGVYEAAVRTAGSRLGLPKRQFRAFPGALPLVGMFVAISTLGGLQPAYLYGHLAGSVASSDKPPPTRARALETVVASVALLALGLVCWIARGFVSSPLASSLLAGCSVVALNRLAFGLVPITFFDGAAITMHSRLMWASLYVPVLTLFVLLILLPAGQRAPGAGVAAAAMLPFLAFALLSLTLWFWFRRTPARQSR